MEFSFDKVANTLYIKLTHEAIKHTEEIGKGIIVDYSGDDFVIGIEILNYTKRNINLNEIIQLNAEEIIHTIVQRQ
ncbi:MAG: DUF2283 domain-containing protein [Promethearchaeota archaeon]|nr:MAG: DUF2283 domain-containing protein [Candidatus Lokiarchaeota archaeon]